jgi:L-methionine (R)-S-oxide reductase
MIASTGEGSTADGTDLLRELRALLAGEPDPVANAANTASLIFARMPRVNWAGFYFLQGDTLVLGPFQGLPACTRIPMGRGVCGTAAASGETIVVDDVHTFPGHIACDSASQSEIVIPVTIGGRLAGVLDIDSPELSRFGPSERTLLEAAATLYAEACQTAFETK